MGACRSIEVERMIQQTYDDTLLAANDLSQRMMRKIDRITHPNSYDQTKQAKRPPLVNLSDETRERERRLNYHFVEDQVSFDRLMKHLKRARANREITEEAKSECLDAEELGWIGKQMWEVLLDRVASKVKPIATINIEGKLLSHHYRKLLEEKAHALNVRVIGPCAHTYNESPANSSTHGYTGCSTLTLIHSDSIEQNVLLGDMLTEKEKALFHRESSGIIFKTKLEDYCAECDLRANHSLLECAIVYGYPLSRAKQKEHELETESNI